MKKKMSKTAWIGIGFLVPTFLIMAYSTLIPGIWGFLISFQDGVSIRKLSFCGIKNYLRIFEDKEFFLALKNTLLLGVGTTILSVLLGILLALAIFKMGHREASVCRLAIFTPFMLPTAIVGLLFVFIFSPDVGMLNSFLRGIGLDNFAKAWLGDPRYNLWAIGFVAVWKGTGLAMILVSTALQSIPASFYEASILDGASYTTVCKKIILPLIKPTILTAATFTLLINFKAFDLVYVLTKGGPNNSTEVMSIYSYKLAFRFDEYGYASAIGMVMILVILLANFACKKLLKGESYEY